MTYNDEWTISDYGLSQQELEVQEVAPLLIRTSLTPFSVLIPKNSAKNLA